MTAHRYSPTQHDLDITGEGGVPQACVAAPPRQGGAGATHGSRGKIQRGACALLSDKVSEMGEEFWKGQAHSPSSSEQLQTPLAPAASIYNFMLLVCFVCISTSPTTHTTSTQIKLAYEAILEQEAGYRPPPPGSAPNMHSAEAYWHTHSTDGRVPWGKYAGGLNSPTAGAWRLLLVAVGVAAMRFKGKQRRADGQQGQVCEKGAAHITTHYLNLRLNPSPPSVRQSCVYPQSQQQGLRQRWRSIEPCSRVGATTWRYWQCWGSWRYPQWQPAQPSSKGVWAVCW